MTAESLQPCDLVMKGGITSGIVYPPAIYEISKHYRIRRIGGASAGAIAAAGAAAAEYGRVENISTAAPAAAPGIVTGHNGKKGFEQLEEIKSYLSKDGNLRNLFQPSPDTKPLMNLVDALFPPTPPKRAKRTQQTGSKPNMLQSLIHILQFAGRLICIWAIKYPCFSWIAVLGIVIGFILLAILPLAIFGFIALFTPEVARYMLLVKLISLACGIIGAWFGLQVGGVVDAIMKLPDNFYGICSGHSNAVSNVLTDWLSDQFNKMAGLKKDEPLTFRHLKNKTLRKGQPDEQKVSITLRMITSNLSQGQPYLLPSGLKGFLFKEDEMHKLFPKDIVKHMVDFAAKDPMIQNNNLPLGYHFLPGEDDLPVVVAMRMSLSFPILLSAIPLYTISAFDAQRIKKDPQVQLRAEELQQNWFSDGGICNNFPIEFFDVWLPRWPTFGINLASMPAKAFENENQQIGPERLSKAHFSALDPAYPYEVASDAAVFLPKADAPQNPEWKDLQDPQFSNLQRIGAFVSAIIGTGLFYHDTLQANLPSYRERVVQIRLSDEEGGLNLNMPHKTIEGIVKKGRKAGELIWNSKNNSQEFNLEYHQWVRFRVLMADLEENFEKMGINLKDPALGNLLTKPFASYSDYPYPPRDGDWLNGAIVRLQTLQCLLKCWQEGTPDLFRKDKPNPETVLRVTPEV